MSQSYTYPPREKLVWILRLHTIENVLLIVILYIYSIVTSTIFPALKCVGVNNVSRVGICCFLYYKELLICNILVYYLIVFIVKKFLLMLLNYHLATTTQQHTTSNISCCCCTSAIHQIWTSSTLVGNVNTCMLLHFPYDWSSILKVLTRRIHCLG